jgi:hypothetical protein
VRFIDIENGKLINTVSYLSLQYISLIIAISEFISYGSVYSFLLYGIFLIPFGPKENCSGKEYEIKDLIRRIRWMSSLIIFAIWLAVLILFLTVWNKYYRFTPLLYVCIPINCIITGYMSFWNYKIIYFMKNRILRDIMES